MPQTSISYKIIGLDCANCAKSLEEKILSTEGVISVKINLIYKKVTILFQDDLVSKEIIEDKIKKSGYSIISDYEKVTIKNYKTKENLLKLILNKKEFYTTIVSIILLIVGILLEYVFIQKLAAKIILIFSTLIGGTFIFKKAFFSLRNLNIDINILMSIAAIAAIIINDRIEAASIVILFSIAEFIESLSVENAKMSIEHLIDFAPSEATLFIENGEQIVQAKDVKIGQFIKVKTGERIPLDGKIVGGEAYINQAPITGESAPIFKQHKDDVFAGTLCEDGTIIIEITKKYEDIFLRKIIDLVENVDQKAPIEKFVDSFAKYYTPIMLLIASLTLLIPPLVTDIPFIDWVYQSLIILVISCPCAVVLSTPITIVAAISRSAKNGVIIKGGSFIEYLGKTKIFAFDKTGTITIGHPAITNIITKKDLQERNLLQIAGSLEANSKHPIAKAIKDKIEHEKITIVEVSNSKSYSGKGIKGEINGKAWFIGNHKFIQDLNIKIEDDLATQVAILESEQKTIVFVANEEEVIGFISLSDQLKPHAKSLVHELKDLKIEKVIMLTGDNYKVAQSISQEVGIDEFYAELMPDQKMKLVKDLNEKYGNIAMVGDGINDAPALAQANVGIALGASGSDVALESADVALMTDSFDSLHYLITLSQKSLRIIKENIIIAILVKIVLFVLSYFGFISLWMAVLIGDMGVSLFVIFNALLRAKGNKMKHTFCDSEECQNENINE